MSRADTYAVRAFEFFDRVRQARTADEIRRMILTELLWFGLDFTTVWSLPLPGMAIEDSFLLNNRPSDYVEHYARMNLVVKDPVITELKRRVTPFTWNDVRTKRKLEKEERAIIEEARGYGATDGLMVPIVSQSGRFAIVSSCGRDPDLSKSGRDALEMISIYGHQALQRALLNERRLTNKEHEQLTSREREVLTWVAAGKSFWDISQILNISERTVEVHASNAKRKLDAAQLAFAVVEAVRRGEISI